MYEFHVGDKFQNDEDKEVVIILLDPLDNRVQYEFTESGVTRWADRTDFLERFKPL